MALVDVDSSSVAVGDDYARLVDLIGYPWLRGRIRDGLLTFHDATCQVAYRDTEPSGTGFQLTAGQGLDWGGGAIGWRVERIWLKEDSAGGGATAVFAGVVDHEGAD